MAQGIQKTTTANMLLLEVRDEAGRYGIRRDKVMNRVEALMMRDAVFVRERGRGASGGKGEVEPCHQRHARVHFEQTAVLGEQCEDHNSRADHAFA